MTVLGGELSSIRIEDLAPSTRSRIVVDESGCWIWQGKRWYGYGPHLRLYDRYVGDRLEDHDLHHVCENGPGGCCNPNHLEQLPTHIHRRMHRQRDGKLTVEGAREVRQHLVEDKITMDELAEMYGVSRWVIQDVGLGRIWLDGDEAVGSNPLVYSRTCGYCKQTFGTTSRRRRYCSTAHQVAYNNLDPRERNKRPEDRIKRTYGGKVVA